MANQTGKWAFIIGAVLAIIMGIGAGSFQLSQVAADFAARHAGLERTFYFSKRRCLTVEFVF